MIAAVIGLFGGAWGKLASYAVVVAGAAAGVLGLALIERRAGAATVRAGEIEREVADSRTATEISATTARESGDQARADLDREFGR